MTIVLFNFFRRPIHIHSIIFIFEISPIIIANYIVSMHNSLSFFTIVLNVIENYTNKIIIYYEKNIHKSQ